MRRSSVKSALRLVLSLVLVVTLLEGTQFTAAHRAARAQADATAGTAGIFVPLQTRILNTTNGTGGYSGPLAAGVWSTVQVDGISGIPASDVSSVQVSLEAVTPATSGYAALSPDLVTPNGTTSLYYTAAVGSVSNTAIVAVGSNGKIKIYVSSAINVVVDVQGYYTDGSATVAGGFAPVTQKRIANTTSGVGVPAARISSGNTLKVPVGGVSGSGVPADASAVFVNLGVINYSTTAGYITTYAYGGTRQSVSENFIAGNSSGIQTAIGVAIPLGPDGSLSSFNVYVSGATVDVLVDIQGYYDGAVSGGAFTPAGARVMDTRVSPNVAIGVNATVSYQVTGLKGIPVVGSGISSVFMNIQAINSTANSGGYLRGWASDQAEPTGTSNLIYGPNAVRSNAMTFQVGSDGKVKIHNVAGFAVNLVIDIQGWYSKVGAPISNGQSRTQQAVTLQATAGGGGDWVTYKYRLGTAGPFNSVPRGNVVAPGTSTNPTWPVQRSSTTQKFDPYTWDLKASLDAVNAPNPTPDTLTQVVACFGASFTDSNLVCSAPLNVTYARTAFGDSYATTDVGPGSLATLSGNFQVSASDVSVPAYQGSLSLGRTLTTLAPINAERPGADGVFGPGWTASLPGSDSGAADLGVSDSSTQGYLSFTGPDGSASIYQATTDVGSYPIGFAGVGDAAADGTTVTKESATQISMLDTGGSITVWTKNASGVWGVSSVTDAGQAGATRYTRDTAGRVTQIVGAVPTNSAGTPLIDCTSAPLTTSGCRTLTLTYSNVTVGGSSVSRLTSVGFTAYDPPTSAIRTIPVASFDYDTTGRLAHAWDPRISPALKTGYTYDGNGRLATLTPPGLAAWSLTYDSSGRLSTAGRYDTALAAWAVSTIVYGQNSDLSLTGLPDLSANAAAAWGQTDDLPYQWTAVFGPDHQPASTTPASVTGTDWPYATISYLDANGRETNTATYGVGAWQYGATGYDSNGNATWTLTPGNRAQALTPSSATDPAVAAITGTTTAASAARAALLTSITTFDPLNPDRATDTLGPAHPVVLAAGPTPVDARSHSVTVYDEGAPLDANGNPTSYGLPTTVTSAAQTLDGADNDPVITHSGYDAVTAGDTTGWTLRQATSTTTQMGTSPSTADLVKITRYNPQGQPIETRLPAGAAGGTAASTVTSYYTAGSSGSCVSNALAGLACSTGPAAQPATGNPLPVTTTTYNIYNAPLVVTQTAGTTVRTSTTTYDGDAPRITTTATTVTPTAAGGTPVPTVTMGYDTATGLPTTQAAGGQALTTGYDSLGRATSYPDATGTVSSTTYSISGDVATASDGKATTSYTYDSATEHRGLLTSQDVGVGTAPGTFTATYNPDGALTSQAYPNGLTATTGFDNTGDATSLTYAKAGTTWMSFTQASNAQGDTVQQTSPQSSQAFSYDPAGRLTQTQDSYAGSCTTRGYTLDRNSNRTSLASYPAATGGACATTTTPATTNATFDQADRITTTGYSYDTLGRTLTVPASDAQGIGSHAATTGTLTVGYYSNDLVATQAQGSAALSFALDPAQNRFASSSDGTSTTTNHYTDSGDSPAWTSTSPSAWTRNITGIGGGLAATVDQTGAVTLQLANLHGDIVATCPDNTSATAISTYTESTEYGAPRTPSTTPDTYSWLGAKTRSTNDLGGLTLMGVRLYNPTTARFLSVDPVPGGNDNSYIYVTNPTDSFDLNGQWGFRRWIRHHWNDVAVGVACTFAGPMGCAVASGLNMAYKWRTHQYHSWTDVAFDGASALGGWGIGRGISGGWRARNIVQSTSRASRWGGSHRAAVAWGRTVRNWSTNASVAGASYGLSYGWSHRHRWF
jgi:RHS repeat-associated protein